MEMQKDDYNWSIEHYELNKEDCDMKLRSIIDFLEIPLLTCDNIHHFKDGDMIRYCGMVQDMLNPEYYYESYTIHNVSTGENMVKSGKYQDLAPCNENEEVKLDVEMPQERLVFYCIPIPNTSKWVDGKINYRVTWRFPFSNPSSSKRSFGELEDDEGIDDYEILNGNRKNPEDAQETSQNVSYSSDMYFPSHEKNGLPCILKIYETEEKCDLVLNDRIEVIGFLSLNPALEATWEDADAEDKTLHPPPSLAPRIHAIFIRKLVHTNPLLKQVFDASEIIANARDTRFDIHGILSDALYGDKLAADYVICCLLSKIYSRKDYQPLGKFSINLFNILKGFSRPFFELLERIVPNCQYIPLTVESLNSMSLVPKKDYETNKLWSARLQMCDDTLLVLDETVMEEGQLNNTGCLNVRALQKLIRDQEVDYDFCYYPVKYNTNVQILVLSEGRSMFETDVHLKWVPSPFKKGDISYVFDFANFFLAGTLLERVRNYFTCMRLQECGLGENLMCRIKEDYVKMRQERKGVASADLHNLLVLSRLLALSNGRRAPILEDWEVAIEMETERRKRFLPSHC